MKLNRNKALAMLASFIILTTVIGVGVWSLGSPSTTVTITPQSLVDAYSYLIFAEGSTYYLKNGSNSQIEYSSTNKTLVQQFAIGNLTSGGSIYLKGMNLNSSLLSSVSDLMYVTEEYFGSYTFYSAGLSLFSLSSTGMVGASFGSNVYLNTNQYFNGYQAVKMAFYQGTGFPSTPVAGQPYYRTDLKTLYVYDGASWNNAGTGTLDSSASYSYLVFINGTTVYMKNGTTGLIDYSSTNASKVFSFAVGNLTQGGTITVKVGVYNIDSTILLNKIGIKILGETWGINDYGVVLNLTTAGIPMFNITGVSPNHIWFVTIEDMELRGNGLADSVGVLIGGETYTSDVILDRVFLNYFTYGMKIGARVQKVWNIWLRDSLIEANTKAGIYFTGTSSVLGNMIDRVTIESNHFASNLNSLYCDTPYVYNVLFAENSVELERQSSINVTNGKNWIITDNRISDCGTSSVNTFGSIFVNGTMLPEPTQWPQGWRISGNIMQNHFTDNMNYSIWLTGKIADFGVHGNNFANVPTAFRQDGLNSSSYGNKFHDNTYSVSPSDQIGAASFVVSVSGSTYSATNCTDGSVLIQSTNATQVLDNAEGNMSAGQTLYIKDGIYNLDSMWIVNKAINIYGSCTINTYGADTLNGTILRRAGAVMLVNFTSTERYENVVIEGIGLDGVNQSGTVLTLDYAFVDMQNVYCINGNIGADLQNTWRSKFTNCYFTRNNYGLYTHTTGNNALRFYSCAFSENDEVGCLIENGRSYLFDSCTFEVNGQWGLKINSKYVSAVQISGGYGESNPSTNTTGGHILIGSSGQEAQGITIDGFYFGSFTQLDSAVTWQNMLRVDAGDVSLEGSIFRPSAATKVGVDIANTGSGEIQVGSGCKAIDWLEVERSFTTSGTVVFVPSSYTLPFSYVVYVDGSTYYMKSGADGQVKYSSTNASKVFIFAIGNLTSGGKIFARAATYVLDTKLTINQVYLTLEGEGKGTILQAATTLNDDVILMTGTSKWYQEVKNLQIDGNKAGGANGTGIYISHTYATTDCHVLVENVWIKNTNSSGVYIPDGNGTREVHLFNVIVSWAGSNGFRLGGTDQKVEHCIAENNVGHGFYIVTSSQLTHCKAFGSGTGSSAKHGFYISGITNGQVILTNCWAQDGIDAGFTVWDSKFVQLIGCTADSNQAEGFRLDGASAGNTDRCILSGCASFTRSGGLYTQTYGIRLKTNTTLCIVTGSYGDGSTAGISDVGTSNQVHISFNGTTYVP